MKKLSEAEIAAHAMAAASHLLVGKAVRHGALKNSVLVTFGPPANMLTLLGWSEWVRRTERSIVHLSFDEEGSRIPTVALVCLVDGQTRIFENCLLWRRPGGGGAFLIPDSFEFGAYAVGADLSLKHIRKPPSPNWNAAKNGMVRASSRLHEIIAEQITSGMELATPGVMERRAA